MSLTPEERLAAVAARRAALQATEARAFAEQQAADLERLVDLEEEHGFDRVLRIDLVGWKPGAGAATLIAVRVPLASEVHVKRFEQTVAKSKERTTSNLDALKVLGTACIVYPSRESEKALYDATIELAPAVTTRAGSLVIEAVQGRAEEEKKD